MIVLLRMTLVIATSYLLLAPGGWHPFGSATSWLIIAALASNILFVWLPSALIESTKFGGFLIIVDTAWITSVLFYSGYQEVDFYLVYFLVLFLAAVSESLALMTLGTILASAGYLYSVFGASGAAVAFSSATLVRVPFFVAVGALYGFLANRVRQEREANQRLLLTARRDPLTNLPNRRVLKERLELGIARTLRTGSLTAVLLIDLDEFKYVNDTHGHAFGDRLLIAISNRLKDRVRKVDVLSRLPEGELHTATRLGGDEFAVVLTEAKNLDSVAMVAEQFRTLISEPVRLEHLEIVTTASIGISVLGGGTPLPSDAAQPAEGARQRLLREADQALYRAKEEGRNTIRFYESEMDRGIKRRLALSQEMRGVLGRDELFLEFQPQVELMQRSITGAEALLRWRHPTRGLVSPSEFVPIAESSGQIQSLGEWILRSACQKASSWRKIHPPGIPVSVNLSPVQLRDPRLPEIVARTLEEEGLSPPLLQLELTEGVFLKATPEVKESLRKLHDEVGVGISLDDFGRGFSSMEYLLRFPIDKLKVDQLFVSSIDVDPHARAMVSGIIALAKKLGLVVVAEGVETESQLEFLRAEGCELAQGFYFSKPVSSQALTNVLVKGGRHIRPSPSTRSASG